MRTARNPHLPLVLFLFVLACIGLSHPPGAGAATASWRFEPSSFDFGVRLPDEGPTPAKAFELQNTGEVSLNPELISLSNQGGSGFKLAGNNCPHPLPAGAACTIEVTFDPTSGGRKAGTLTVEAPGATVAAATVQLSGSGGEPLVVVDPATVTFDTVPIPAMAVVVGSLRTVTVTNAGSADLTIGSLGYQEAKGTMGARPNFLFPGLLGPGLCNGATVAPGASCSLIIEFSPRAPGTYSAQLELEDNALGSPQVISLVGTAVAQAPPPPGPTSTPGSWPKLGHKPRLRTRSRTATFKFSAASSPGGFQCRSGKGKPFLPCTSPVRLRGLKPGPHLFAVRAIGTYGLPGPIMSYRWRILR